MELKTVFANFDVGLS